MVQGEGGGEGRWRTQAMLLPPPSRPSPARGEGVEGPGRRGENRELNGPGRLQEVSALSKMFLWLRLLGGRRVCSTPMPS